MRTSKQSAGHHALRQLVLVHGCERDVSHARQGHVLLPHLLLFALLHRCHPSAPAMQQHIAQVLW